MVLSGLGFQTSNTLLQSCSPCTIEIGRKLRNGEFLSLMFFGSFWSSCRWEYEVKSNKRDSIVDDLASHCSQKPPRARTAHTHWGAECSSPPLKSILLRSLVYGVAVGDGKPAAVTVISSLLVSRVHIARSLTLSPLCFPNQGQENDLALH